FRSSFHVPPSSLQSKTVPDGRSKTGLVEGIEMQPGGTASQQVLAQARDDVEAEGPDRSDVVAVALQTHPHPAWNLRAAGVGEAGELGKVADRHDAGDDRQSDARRLAGVDEAVVGVGVVEILRDRR